MTYLDCPRCEGMLEGYARRESDDRDIWTSYEFVQGEEDEDCKCNHTPEEEKQMIRQMEEREGDF